MILRQRMPRRLFVFYVGMNVPSPSLFGVTGVVIELVRSGCYDHVSEL